MSGGTERRGGTERMGVIGRMVERAQGRLPGIAPLLQPRVAAAAADLAPRAARRPSEAAEAASPPAHPSRSPLQLTAELSQRSGKAADPLREHEFRELSPALAAPGSIREPAGESATDATLPATRLLPSRPGPSHPSPSHPGTSRAAQSAPPIHGDDASAPRLAEPPPSATNLGPNLHPDLPAPQPRSTTPAPAASAGAAAGLRLSQTQPPSPNSTHARPDAASEAAEHTEISITIGSIELRAPQPPQPHPAPRRPPAFQPRVSLESYLRRRAGGDA